MQQKETEDAVSNVDLQETEQDSIMKSDSIESTQRIWQGTIAQKHSYKINTNKEIMRSQ